MGCLLPIVLVLAARLETDLLEAIPGLERRSRRRISFRGGRIVSYPMSVVLRWPCPLGTRHAHTTGPVANVAPTRHLPDPKLASFFKFEVDFEFGLKRGRGLVQIRSQLRICRDGFVDTAALKAPCGWRRRERARPCIRDASLRSLVRMIACKIRGLTARLPGGIRAPPLTSDTWDFRPSRQRHFPLCRPRLSLSLECNKVDDLSDRG